MSIESAVNIHRANPPQWFQDADLGIFIHWTPSSVPAYAPTNLGDFGEMVREHDLAYIFRNQPYAEWYLNSLKIPGSPVQLHHQEKYGDQSYQAFAEEFRKRAVNVDVNHWADMFAIAGAKYVVLVTKHHDGFLLFNSRHPNPRIPGYQLDFDLVGDLAKACRERGMRFGTYYSSLLDWSFYHKPLQSAYDIMYGDANTKEYRDYCRNHWLELIERYKPDVLWSDIGYPHDPRLEDLFRHYYNMVPEGMVNDRWAQSPVLMRNPLGRWIINRAARKALESGSSNPLPAKYYDYRTLEYTTDWQETDIWFEVCRGMDKSFGYNQNSRKEDFITPEEVLRMIAEVYPKKGRLLLNVGPDSYGRIPEYQEEVLEALGTARRA